MNNQHLLPDLSPDLVYDCIIIGAGPGGLQAAIYLGRFNRNVLLIDRGGGRTAHAKRIENFLSHEAISGKELIELGMEQAARFNVRIEKGLATSVLKKEHFEVGTHDRIFRSRFAIAATGVMDVIPPIENVYAVFAKSYFTCINCDGYETSGKKSSASTSPAGKVARSKPHEGLVPPRTVVMQGPCGQALPGSVLSFDENGAAAAAHLADLIPQAIHAPGAIT